MTTLAQLNVAGKGERLIVGAGCAIGRVSFLLHDTVRIGDRVVVNDGVQFLAGTHDVHTPGWELIAKPIEVGDYAWIATSAIILPGVTIGRGAVVGAGAVVSRSVAAGRIVVGNPAREVGERRCLDFVYQPTRLTALFEAWLGRG